MPNEPERANAHDPRTLEERLQWIADWSEPGIDLADAGTVREALDTIKALKAENARLRAGIPAIWRNAVTNTVALVDKVRARHRPCARNVAYANFDKALDAALSDWSTATRKAGPTTYEESESAWHDFMAARAALEGGGDEG